MSQSEKDVKETESSTEAEVVDVQESDVQSISDVMAEPSLADQLEQVSRQRDEWREKAYRAAAELDNGRKRFQKERVELRTYGVETLIQELLPVTDNLERAVAHAKADNNLAEGVKMVLRQFMQILASKGAVPFDAMGEPFDPSVHEAMSQIPSDTHEPGTVIEVFQKGWMLKERLVRPAMVVVAAEPPAAEPQVGAEEASNTEGETAESGAGEDSE